MLTSYLKIAWRNLIKNKVSSFINVGGLAIGMTVTILIVFWIHDDLSFNKYHKNYDRIAQVMQNQTFNGIVETWNSQAMQLGPELRSNYGRNFKYVVRTSWTNDHLLTAGKKKLSVSGNYMEPEITEMLTLKMVRGARSGLQDPSSLLLSRSTAEALFGTSDPINQTIEIDNKLPVKVTGVYEDIPHNSTFLDLNFIAPWELLVKSEGFENKLNWGNSWFQTFVQLADNVSMSEASANIRDSKLKRVIVEDDDARFKPVIFLQPMSRFHLYSDFKNGVNVGGRIQYVWMFGIVGAFVLLLACINFMNLSTARSEKRAKEVGIRKTLGSHRKQLIAQFYSESMLVALLALLLSLLLVHLILPFFNEVAGKRISLFWNNPFFWLFSLGFSLFTGFIAGSYPAVYLSSFRPIKVLKGGFRVGRFAAIPRKVLVVVQFTVSIAIAIGTMIVFRQIQYTKNRPVGYSADGLIAVPIKTDDINKHFDVFRADLLKTGAVEEVAASENPITATSITNSGYTWKGKDPDMQEEFVTLSVTHEFGKTIGWQIKEGRDFSKELASDSSGFIINEAAAKYMGLKNPVGENMKRGENENYKIIGVVKDLITQSPYSPVKQTIFFLHYHRVAYANIRIKPEVSASTAIKKIEAVFKKHDPANLFEYRFIDEEYAKKFGNEERIGKLSAFFAILAILISCLGLFGLASFVAEQRTKEIGIRKVLGATVTNLWRMLSKDFVVLVMLSCCIAVPVSYYFLQNWLQNYEFRTDISWWIFAAAGAGAMIITLLTVSFQAVKAALMNPVKSLRSE